MRYITGAFCERGLILKRLSAILLHNFKIFHHYGRKNRLRLTVLVKVVGKNVIILESCVLYILAGLGIRSLLVFCERKCDSLVFSIESLVFASDSLESRALFKGRIAHGRSLK